MIRVLERPAQYDRDNLAIARQVAADPEAIPALKNWARLVLARLGTDDDRERGQQRLAFDSEVKA
jgi:hypothetical protein